MMRCRVHLHQAINRQRDRDAWFDHDRAYPEPDEYEPEDYDAEDQDDEDEQND